MLSKENNELLTRVGRGTPMGELMRRFWFPALLEEEIAQPDCPPVQLRLLGEDLVAFRDTEGRIGILQEHCRHRRASLFLGRNEECGLRCVYHGWKFDVDGNCVDIPSEPNPEPLLKKASIAAYPAVARGGMVWIYMGPRELMPERLPELEFAYLPETQRTATKRIQQCNWAQAVEGGIDSSHVSFLHSKLEGMGGGNFGRQLTNLFTVDRHPVFEVEETGYGLAIAARRSVGEDRYYWRITQFLTPFFQMIPPAMEGEDSDTVPYAGHAWVPIDDETTWTWSFGANPYRPFTAEEREFSGGPDGMWGPIDENYRPKLNRKNLYGLDREAQRTESFTGIQGIGTQDAAVQESMGAVVDRTDELLGTSDAAIIQWRKLMLTLVRELEAGKEPEPARHGERYNVRSASCVLSRDMDWRKGAAWLMAGTPLEGRQEVAE